MSPVEPIRGLLSGPGPPKTPGSVEMDLISLKDSDVRIMERLDELEKRVDTLGFDDFVNATGSPIVSGTLISLEGGVVVVADASARSTAAWMVAVDLALPQEKFRGVWVGGDVSVRTVGNADIVQGDEIWLSETSGLVTKTIVTVSGGIRQIVGDAIEDEDETFTGRVRIQLRLDPNNAIELL